MITIVAKSMVAADKIDQFKKIASELVDESRKESGNVAYSLYQDINNPQVLTFIEVWKDQAAIDAHNQSTHFTGIVPRLGELRIDSEVHLYTEL
jgi:quinol monooxygenase YgiN